MADSYRRNIYDVMRDRERESRASVKANPLDVYREVLDAGGGKSDPLAVYRQVLEKKRQEEERKKKGNALSRTVVKEEQTKEKTPNIIDRVTGTIQDARTNLSLGLFRSIEGTVDFVAGLGGAAAGLVSRDAQDAVKGFIEKDWTGIAFKKYTDIYEGFLRREYAYGSVQSPEGIAAEVEQAIGGMLPAVAVSIATSGAASGTMVSSLKGATGAAKAASAASKAAKVSKVASMATMATGAAGQSTQEAYRDGASYGRGLAYGTLRGATEAGTEMLVGGVAGRVMGTGTGVFDDVARSVARNKASRIALEAAGEGLEEVLSEAADPLTRSVYKGSEALNEYASPEFAGRLGKSFGVGALTSTVFGQTVGRATGQVGTEADVRELLSDVETLDKKRYNLDLREKLTTEADAKIEAQELEDYHEIEGILKKAAPEKRAGIIERLGLETKFSEDGTLREDFTASIARKFSRGVAATVGENGAREASAGSVAPFERRMASVDADPEAVSRALSKKGRVQYVGELSGTGKQNLKKLKSVMHRFSDLSRGALGQFVIADESVENDAYYDPETGYIVLDKDVLEREDGVKKSVSRAWFAATLHEVTHGVDKTVSGVFMEAALGTLEDGKHYSRVFKELSNRGYLPGKASDIRKRIERYMEKQAKGQALTEKESAELNVFHSECAPLIAERVLNNEHFLRELIAEDASLVERLLGKMADLRESTSRVRDPEARAVIKEIRAIEETLLDAVAERGMAYRDRKLVMVNREREDEEVRYSNKGEYDSEKAGIADQIKHSQRVLNDMNPVYDGTVPENIGTKEAGGTWAISELQKYGFRADRQNFGTIYFDEKSIRNAMNYLDTNEEKASIVAVFRVLKQGVQIGEHGDHKGRAKHTVTFAAPVVLNGTRGNMAVVVNMKNNKYYVHRILMPDGSAFKFDAKQKDAKRESQRGVPKGSLANATSSASNRSVSHPDNSVNRKNAENLQNGTDRVLESRKPKAKKPANEHAFDDAVRRTDEREAGADVDAKVADDAVTRANEEKVQVSEDKQEKTVLRPSFTHEQIQDNMTSLAKMDAVEKIDASKLERTGKRPKDIFMEFFDRIGNRIESPVFGSISLSNSSAKSEIRHGLTAEKIASIEAIPSVIQNGKVIFHERKGDSDVERIVVCAPIQIAEDDYYMGVMLQRDSQNQRLYLHSVVAVEASEKEMTTSSQANRVTNGALEDSDHLFATSILQRAVDVKVSERNSRKKNVEGVGQAVTQTSTDIAVYKDNAIEEKALEGEVLAGEVLIADAASIHRRLARVLEGMAQTDKDYAILKEFESHLDELDLMQGRMRELSHRIDAVEDILYHGDTPEERRRANADLKPLRAEWHRVRGEMAEITKKVLRMQDLEAIRNVLNHEKWTMRKLTELANDIAKAAEDLFLWKNEVFFNRTGISDVDLFRRTLGKLTTERYRGHFNQKGARKCIGAYGEWYLSDEAKRILGDGEDWGVYSAEIAEKIQTVANGTGALTVDDLQDILDIMNNARRVSESYATVFKNGKRVDAHAEAKEYELQIATHVAIHNKVKSGIMDFLFRQYGEQFGEPAALFHYIDRHRPGFLTDYLDRFRDSSIQTQAYEFEMLRLLDEVLGKHKGYLQNAHKRTVTYTDGMGATYDIPADVATAFYMSLLSPANAGMLAASGFAYRDAKGKEHRPNGFMLDAEPYMTDPDTKRVRVTEEAIARAKAEAAKLKAQFTEADIAYIKAVDAAFKRCGELKTAADLERNGWTNTMKNGYFPVTTAYTAKQLGDWRDEIKSVSQAAFNHHRTEGNRHEVRFSSLDDIARSHIHGIAMYAGLGQCMDDFQLLYNMDVSGNPNKPVSIRTELARLWPGGGQRMEKYLTKFLEDVQGKSKPEDSTWAQTFDKIRGNVALSHITGNVKVLLTQTSSYIAAGNVIDMGNLLHGINPSLGKDVDKYSTLAMLRHKKNEAALAQGVLDRLDGIHEFISQPIGFMDRRVIVHLFAACQDHVAKTQKLEIGTEENKRAAGKILDRIILETQQSSLVTERSAAMRSKNVLLRMFTTFTADSMKQFARLWDGFSEMAVLTAEAKFFEKGVDKARMSAARKRTARAAAVLAVQSAYMVAISWIMRKLLKKDDEEETAKDLVLDFIGNLLSGLPVIRDVYDGIVQGYGAEDMSIAAFNDVVNSIGDLVDMAHGIASGELTGRQVAYKTRQAIFAIGSVAGIPAKNLYNFARAIVHWVSPEAGYKMDDAFYKSSYRADMADAIASEDEAQLETIIGVMLNENVGRVTSESVRVELGRLMLAGEDALPRSVPEVITVGDDSVKLTARQRKRFETIYGEANVAVEKMIGRRQYGDVDDAVRAKAIKQVYGIYYNRAVEELLGVELEAKNVLFAEAFDPGDLALIVAACGEIRADVGVDGKAISGSRKEKVIKYVESLKLRAAQKYMIMGYLGYRNTTGRQVVFSYIESLRISKAKKEELFALSGYGATI